MSYVPNFGRDPSVWEPPGVEHLYPDLPQPIDVYILVWTTPDIKPIDRHWAIGWKVGQATNGSDVHRRMEVGRERGPKGLLNHLTNWGPKTRIMSSSSAGYVKPIYLGHLSYSARQAIENIVHYEPVVVPNGVWNCQDWVKSVIRKSVHAGVLEGQRAEYCIGFASVLRS